VRDRAAFQFMDINMVEWSDKGTIPLQMVKRTEDVELALAITQKYLGEKFVRPLYGDYHMDYCDLVNGMDDNVYEWHNDYEKDKVNLGILLYYTDTDEDTGTKIEFRHADSKEFIDYMYPKEMDICIINHGTKFEHRVTEQLIPLPRIVASFHYYVNGIN
jgi:hypothetical protein